LPLNSRQGLSGRIVFFVTVVVALCGVFTVLTIAGVIASQLDERYRSDRQAAIEYLSTSLVPMVEIGDYLRVERTISAVLVYDSIVSVAVYDDEGELIRSVVQLGEESRPTDTISHVLMQGDLLVGRVDIGFSRLYIQEDVQELTGVLALAVILLLAVMAGALLWYLRRTVVNPLRIFTSTVRAMTSRNMDLRVPVTGSDEIGMLASSFNDMAQELQESHFRLRKAHIQLEERYLERTSRDQRRADQVRTIFELRQQLIEIADLRELLQYVASALQRAFSYNSVNVFLVEPESGDLELAATAVMTSGTTHCAHRVKAGDGIVGDVLQSCRPLLVTDMARDPRYMELHSLNDTKAELAVPINIGALTLGVLDVQSNYEGGLDEMDLFTAQTVADQLANVVENTRLAQETREIAVLDERNRMAREIHDTLAQGFTGIVLQLEAAEQSIADAPESVTAHIDRAKRLARESLTEARRSVWALRPATLEKRQLIDALRRETSLLSDETKMQATCHISGNAEHLPADVEDALLRICQEALTNVRRHSQSSHVHVQLTHTDQQVVLSVRDDGVGFDLATVPGDSFGLIGIEERARQCRGHAHITSSPGKGTVVEIAIPLQRSAEDE